MAGAGYKLFNTGDVLTAAQVNTYLQEQVVMVFANAAARTTALSGVLAEGMVTYLKDTDALEIYSGAAWVGYGSGDITGITTGATSGLTGGVTSGTADLKLNTTAKGGLLVGTGSGTVTELAVGSNTQVLTADSTTASGLKWAAAGSSGFPAATSFTPTVTSQGGSITSYSAQGYYYTSGKIVIATYRISLTNVGTATGNMIVTLPVTAKSDTNKRWVGACWELNNTGKTGMFALDADTNATTFIARDYVNATYFANGNIVAGTIAYEVA
jgi:hypothetical protein